MIKKTAHIVLAFILLVTTMGLTINMHYCQHKLYAVSIFSDNLSCCAEHKEAPQHRQAFDHQHKHDQHQCCNTKNHTRKDCADETVQIGSTDDYVPTPEYHEFNNLPLINLFILVPVFSDFFHVSAAGSENAFEWNISPPRIQVVLSLLQKYRF